ncbi:MAG: hypothetical protein MJ252_25425 [archaeon]|nr:hypothetical protein [archaeon]
MDTINKMNRITEKMKCQMLAKGIDSLDKVMVVMTQFDPNGTGAIEVSEFETFLSRLGIFLKTQELSEIHKFLGTHETGRVQFEQFAAILKSEVPPILDDEVGKVFEKIKDSEDGISIATLYEKFDPEKHPRVLLMLKEVPQVKNEFDVAIKFVLGDKTVMNKEDFIELHRNMFWVNPKENTVYFYRMIPGIWKC